MINLRKITSLILFFVGFLVALTGIVLFLIPAGRVAYWNNWLLWGMSKTEYVDLHINLSFIFVFFSIFHIVYNWKILISYFRGTKVKLVPFPFELVIALGVTLLVSFGTYFKVFPFKNVISLGESLKVSLWGQGLEPPYGHAELSSLKILIERLKLDGLLVEENLKRHKISYQNIDSQLIIVAKNNHLAPSELYRIMTKSSKSKNKLPESGVGKLTFNEISKILEIPLDQLKLKFLGAGYQIDESMTLKEAANQKGVSPHDLIELIESTEH